MLGSLFPSSVELTHFHLFCGLGGGAVGFNRGVARVGNLRATMRCVGGVDSDPRAIADFTRLVGAPGTVLDLFSREQYEAWHGAPPPEGWREALPSDLRAAVLGGMTPDIVFTSAPCKGFSGLQAPERAKTRKYQALNELTVRGFWLLLEAFKDDPVPLIIMENVPRIGRSGDRLLDQIDALLECAGYAVAHTVHDAGELGGLGQRRKRFLLVARHRTKVPPFLYEAPRKPLRTVGEVIGDLPLPETGPRIHRLPKIEWRTWMRLALVEAGKDWRSLQSLEIDEEGMVRGLRLVRSDLERIEDPRAPRDLGSYQPYGVKGWGETASTVTGQAAPGAGMFSVADPRMVEGVGRHSNVCRVTEWEEPAHTVTSARGSHAAIADPRLEGERPRFNDVFKIVAWDETAGAVTGATGNARPNVADPRLPGWVDGRETWDGGGHYGVVSMDDPSNTVTSSARHDRGPWSVADTRVPAYAAGERPKDPPLIIALDGTYHRPFTTLELAALQGFDPAVLALGLAGKSDGDWRERIGNAVPPPAATAIASTMAETLLLARLGETRALHAAPVWVMPLATALSINVGRA